VKHLVFFAAALAVVAVTTPALADDPKPGATVTVTCKGNPEQKYSCYVPKAYTPKSKWPILYCFAPDGQGDLFVRRYKEVCERRGWIVVGSLNSKNGPWGPIKAAIDAMWADTAQRFSLRKKMRYATGFSGGARVSFALAEQRPEFIVGVIAIGAGLSTTNRALPESLAVFMVCGETDPNRRELDALKKRFGEEGRSFHYENFPGGHVMPPVALLEKAVEWMDDRAVERKAERFDAALTKAAELREAGEPVKAWITLLEVMRALPDQPNMKAAEKLSKSLARDPAVKPEAAALKKLLAAEKWLKKNEARVAKSTSVRAQAEKKLKEVTEKYPDTWAAGRVEGLLASLPESK